MPFILATLLTGIQAIGAWFAAHTVARFAFGLAISLGLNWLGRSLEKKGDEGEPLTGTEIAPQAGAVIPRNLIIGETAVFGQVVYHNSYGANNEFLERIVALQDWVAERITGVIINNRYYTTGIESQSGAKTVYSLDGVANESDIMITFYNGTQTAADPDVGQHADPVGVDSEGSPGNVSRSTSGPTTGLSWDSNSKLIGIAYAIIRFKHREGSQFFKGGGAPDVKLVVKGAKLYDWRKDSTNGGVGSHRWNNVGTWEWSDNPVVAAYNYHRGFYLNSRLVFGQGVPVTDINHPSYTAAANVCDELVELAAGGTEKRYRIAINISADRDIPHAETLDAIRTAFAGYIYDDTGAYYVRVGDDQSVVAAVTDADLAADETISYAAKRPRTELANIITGEFLATGAQLQWNPMGYTEQKDTAGIAADGEEIARPLQLLMVPSQYQAERIARIKLRELRQQATAQFTLPSSWLRIKSGDWITWRSKTWRVASRSINFATAKMQLAMEEINATVYSWTGVTDEGPVVIPPIIYVPGAQLLQPTNFTATAIVVNDGAGTYVPYLLFQYAPILDPSVVGVRFEYRIKNTGGGLPGDSLQAIDDSPEDGKLLWPDMLLSPLLYEARALLICDPPRDSVTPTAWEDVVIGSDLYYVAAAQYWYSRLSEKAKELIESVDRDAPGWLNDAIEKINAAVTWAMGQSYEQEISIQNALVAKFDNAWAGIFTEQTVRAAADSAFASDITVLFASVDINAADIITEQTARAAADSAHASSISALQAQIILRNRVFYQAAPPTADNIGDMWFDSDDTNHPYRWSGSAWVSVRDLSIHVFAQAAAPTAIAVGDLWVDTDLSNRLFRWNGTSWVEVTDTRVAANATAISALDTRVTSVEGVNTAQATAITAVETRADAATASGLVKLEATSGPAGATATFGVFLRTTEGGAYNTDAAFLLQIVSAGVTRAVFDVSEFYVFDGTANNAVAFAIAGGITYLGANVYAQRVIADYIETAHIKAGQITTPTIANNAVTKSAFAYIEGSINYTGGAETTVLTAPAIDPENAPTICFVSIRAPAAGPSTDPVIRLYRDSTLLTSYAPLSGDAAGFSMFMFIDAAPGSGNKTYTLKVNETIGAGGSVRARSLVVLTLKK